MYRAAIIRKVKQMNIGHGFEEARLIYLVNYTLFSEKVFTQQRNELFS